MDLCLRRGGVDPDPEPDAATSSWLLGIPAPIGADILLLLFPIGEGGKSRISLPFPLSFFNRSETGLAGAETDCECREGEFDLSVICGEPGMVGRGWRSML